MAADSSVDLKTKIKSKGRLSCGVCTRFALIGTRYLYRRFFHAFLACTIRLWCLCVLP